MHRLTENTTLKMARILAFHFQHLTPTLSQADQTPKGSGDVIFIVPNYI